MAGLQLINSNMRFNYSKGNSNDLPLCYLLHILKGPYNDMSRYLLLLSSAPINI